MEMVEEGQEPKSARDQGFEVWGGGVRQYFVRAVLARCGLESSERVQGGSRTEV